MSPADHQDRGEGWIRSGSTKFLWHRNACRGAALQKTAFPSAGLRLCSTVNQRESPQTANIQVQDLPVTAAIPREGNTAHRNDPHAGEELQECRTISCPWTEISSSLWGGNTSPVSFQKTAETHKPHHPQASYSKYTQQPILTVCICTHNAGVFPSQL